MGIFNYLPLLKILFLVQCIYLLQDGIQLSDYSNLLMDDHNIQSQINHPNIQISYISESQCTCRESSNCNDLKEKKTNSLLSDTMSLSQIELEMKNYPPRFEFGNQRLLIMESLDKIIDFSVRDDNRDEIKLKEIVSFYQRQVDQALSKLEKTKVNEGVHIFKFYSSSLILKSAEGTVAIDFCQGPVGNDYKLESYDNEGEPEKSDYFKTGFYMTTKQRDRLAKLVDVYIITHPHQDHVDYSLAKRMIQEGKPVIGPEQLTYKWSDLSRDIIVPSYNEVQKFGPCEIFSQSGYQYKRGKKLDNGEFYGIPTRYLSHDVESIRYLIKIGGIIFLHSAETQAEAYMWLELAKSING